MAQQFRGIAFPIHRITLEANRAVVQMPLANKSEDTLELESNCMGAIKLKLGESEIWLSSKLLLRAVAALSPD